MTCALESGEESVGCRRQRAALKGGEVEAAARLLRAERRRQRDSGEW